MHTTEVHGNETGLDLRTANNENDRQRYKCMQCLSEVAHRLLLSLLHVSLIQTGTTLTRSAGESKGRVSGCSAFRPVSSPSIDAAILPILPPPDEQLSLPLLTFSLVTLFK